MSTVWYLFVCPVISEGYTSLNIVGRLSCETLNITSANDMMTSSGALWLVNIGIQIHNNAHHKRLVRMGKNIGTLGRLVVELERV